MLNIYMKKSIIFFIIISILTIGSILAYSLIPEKVVKIEKIDSIDKFLAASNSEIISQFDSNKDGTLDHEEKNLVHEKINIDKTKCPYKAPELSDKCPFKQKGFSDEQE